MCQMGCPVKTTSMGDMLTHFKDKHNREELAKWGINLDVITLGKSHGVLPDEYVRKQLNKFAPPVLKCEERKMLAELSPLAGLSHPSDMIGIQLKEKLKCDPDPMGIQNLSGNEKFRRFGFLHGPPKNQKELTLESFAKMKECLD